MLSADIIATAKTLIELYGSSITINRYSSDYVDGEMQETLTSSSAVKATIESYESQEIGGLVQSGDIRLTVANNGFTIDQAKDIVMFGGNRYDIINVEPLYLQDQIIIYNLHVRK